MLLNSKYILAHTLWSINMYCTFNIYLILCYFFRNDTKEDIFVHQVKYILLLTLSLYRVILTALGR